MGNQVKKETKIKFQDENKVNLPMHVFVLSRIIPQNQ
jgi:hypothetical protein